MSSSKRGVEAKVKDSPEQSRELAGEIEERLPPGGNFALNSDALRSVDPTSAADLWRALHDMRVGMIELEVQNEELRRQQAALDEERDHYAQLFDNAPTGQFLLADSGLVLDVNAVARGLLGSEASALCGRDFTRLICALDQDAYYLARKRLLGSGARQSCSLRLRRRDGHAIAVKLSMGLQHAADGSHQFQLVLEPSDLFDAPVQAPMSDAVTRPAAGQHVSRHNCFTCALRESCLPRGLSESELSILNELVGSGRTLVANEQLIRSEDSARRMYVLRSGAMKSTVIQEDGTTQIVAFHFPGELICAEAFQSFPFDCNVEALQRSQLCFLSHDRIHELCERMPTLQEQLLRMMADEIGRDREHVVSMGQHTALKRMVRFVRGLSLRFRQQHWQDQVLQLPMTRADIGNYLGLAEETVCRVLKNLEREGLIKLNRKELRIVDEPGLMAKLDDDA
jgi:CRP/FNR family transcriptional regulator, anaerobic regulatory protein